jgi:hypothetical protein
MFESIKSLFKKVVRVNGKLEKKMTSWAPVMIYPEGTTRVVEKLTIHGYIEITERAIVKPVGDLHGRTFINEWEELT